MTTTGLADAARRAVPTAAATYAAAAALLLDDPSPAALAAARSGLNGDGSPLQLSLSARAETTAVRLLGDPGFLPASPDVRWQRARAALARVLAGAHPDLAALSTRALAACGPADDVAAARWTRGVLWLATALDGPGLALWIDLGPWPDPWHAARRALAALLPAPDAAFALVDRVAASTRPTSLGLEGSTPADLRVKLYWKLARACALEVGGAPGHTDPLFLAFLARVGGERPYALGSLHMSAGFRVRDGRATDVKIDVCACAACRSVPASDWPALLGDLGRLCEVDAHALATAADGPGVEPALVGLGIGDDGRRRLNLYVKEAPCQ